MKSTVKHIVTSTSAVITSLTLATAAFAQGLAPLEGKSLNPCDKIGDPWNKLCLVSTDNIPGFIGNFILLLFIVAALIALLFLIWGGIKWILSGGDKTKVDTARQTIIAALIGLVITFLAFFLLQIILGVFGIDIKNLVLPKLLG